MCQGDEPGALQMTWNDAGTAGICFSFHFESS